MNRRKTLKLLAAASAGVALGHWSIGHGAVKKLIQDSFFNPDEQDLITAIADTFIPKREQYGALDLGVPIYLLGYFSKCAETDVQDNIRQQLKALNTAAAHRFKRDFTQCSLDQRVELLRAFSNSGKERENVFFETMKSQTIQGFLTTEEVMTGFYHYRVAPGLYTGCMDVGEPSIT